VPALNVDVLPSHNPIKVGQDSTFVIRVLNPGTTMLDDVIVSFRGIAQLPITGSMGPGDRPGRGAGAGQIDFDPVAIPPGRAALFEVRVRGERPGKGRIKVSAGSPRSFTTPYVQDQSITVYDPNGEPGKLDQARANQGGGLQLSAPTVAPAAGSRRDEAPAVPVEKPAKMTYFSPTDGGAGAAAADEKPTFTLSLPATKTAAGEPKLAAPTFNVSESGSATAAAAPVPPAAARPTSAKPAIVPDLPKD
jgi:hypothetical protein